MYICIIYAPDRSRKRHDKKKQPCKAKNAGKSVGLSPLLCHVNMKDEMLFNANHLRALSQRPGVLFKQMDQNVDQGSL